MEFFHDGIQDIPKSRCPFVRANGQTLSCPGVLLRDLSPAGLRQVTFLPLPLPTHWLSQWTNIIRGPGHLSQFHIWFWHINSLSGVYSKYMRHVTWSSQWCMYMYELCILFILSCHWEDGGSQIWGNLLLSSYSQWVGGRSEGKTEDLMTVEPIILNNMWLEHKWVKEWRRSGLFPWRVKS